MASDKRIESYNKVGGPLWKGALALSDGNPKLAYDLFKVFTETANQESHYGELSSNVMQVDPIQVEDIFKARPSRYSDSLNKLGGVSDMDTSNPDTSMKLGMATLVANLKKGNHDISTKEGRAAFWKSVYNSKAGKGTEDKYLETNKDVDWRYTDEWFKGQYGE